MDPDDLRRPPYEFSLQGYQISLNMQTAIYERACAVWGPEYINSTDAVPVSTFNTNFPITIIDHPTNLTRRLGVRRTLERQKNAISNLLTYGDWVKTNVIAEGSIIDHMDAIGVNADSDDINLVETQFFANVGLPTNGSWWVDTPYLGYVTSSNGYRVMDQMMDNMIWTWNQGAMMPVTHPEFTNAVTSTNQVGSLYVTDAERLCNHTLLCDEMDADWDWAGKNVNFANLACYTPPNPDQFSFPHSYISADFDIYQMFVVSNYLEGLDFICQESCLGYDFLDTVYYGIICYETDSYAATLGVDTFCSYDPTGGCSLNLAECPESHPYFTDVRLGTAIHTETNACQFDAFIATHSANTTYANPNWRSCSNVCEEVVQALTWTLSRNSFPIFWSNVCWNAFAPADVPEHVDWELVVGVNNNACQGSDPPFLVAEADYGPEDFMTGNIAYQAWTNYVAPVTNRNVQWVFEDDWVTDDIPYDDEDCGEVTNAGGLHKAWAIGNAILISDWCETEDGFTYCPPTDIDPF